MNPRILIVFLMTLISCNEIPSFQFRTTSDRLGKIIGWNNKIIVTDKTGDLYEINGTILRKFDKDGIVSISKCKNEFYLLKAPNDTTLIIENPDGEERVIKNRSGFKSKYFQLWTNEKCKVILEYSMIAFTIQEDSLIDLNKIYGFKENTSLSGSDRFGYYDNFIFLAKYSDYISGGIYQSYLDKDSSKYHLAGDTKIRDFTIHNDQLWLITGYFESIDDRKLIKRKILKVEDGKIDEVILEQLSDKMDIASIYSDNDKIYFLSENLGFFKLENNKLENTISIDLKHSNVIPESFIVKDNSILLSTFENGVLKFTINHSDFTVEQITTEK